MPVLQKIYCGLLRCCEARVSNTGFFLVGPTKVLFTKKLLCNENKEHLIDISMSSDLYSQYEGTFQRIKRLASINFFGELAART